MFCIVSLAIRWPGIVTYDGVGQYQQALEGDYADWNPPIMARAWALLNHLHGGGAPFFLIQMLLWWGGFGLLAAAMARQRRASSMAVRPEPVETGAANAAPDARFSNSPRQGGAAILVLLIAAAPLFLGWATVVIKDAQMACCLIAATGLIAHWRLDGRAVPVRGAVPAGLLIAYATLVRGNALFATVPLGLALANWGGIVAQWRRAALALCVMLAVIVVTPFINHRVFGARAGHVERALQVYDLAGIAYHARLAAISGVPAALSRAAEEKGCYTPYYWNPYGEATQCGAIGDALAFGEDASPHLDLLWAGQIARHPLAYAEHRAGHLNDNLRFWVAQGEPDGAPQAESEPNDLGLGAHSGAAGRWLVAAGEWMLRTPLGWPCAWLAVSLALSWASPRSARGAQAALGRALALSAACMSGSFAVVSIASDLRYHIWSMVAAALALILLADARALERKRAAWAMLAVLLVTAAASAARLGLAPSVYRPIPPVAAANPAAAA